MIENIDNSIRTRVADGFDIDETDPSIATIEYSDAPGVEPDNIDPTKNTEENISKHPDEYYKGDE